VEAGSPVSLYLAVPPSDIDRTRPLVRLVLNQIGRRLTESLVAQGRELPASRRHKLLLMLDEFPALGRLPFFENALSYLPGYGVKAYLIAQDLSQLYAGYGRDESIVSNCHVRIAYAPNKIETAKLLSEMTGSMTVYREMRSYTGNRLAPFLFHVIASEQESQRPLLTPDEALRLPEEAALIFAAGFPPIHGRKIRYYRDAVFSARASEKEPACPAVIEHDWSRWASRSHETREPESVTRPEETTYAPTTARDELL
jgi:type IV secretion system protein VirD4